MNYAFDDDDIALARWHYRYELEKQVRASRTDLDLWEYLTKLAVATAVVGLGFHYGLVSELLTGILLTIIWINTGKDIMRGLNSWLDRNPTAAFVIVTVSTLGLLLMPLIYWFVTFGAVGAMLKITHFLIQ